MQLLTWRLYQGLQWSHRASWEACRTRQIGCARQSLHLRTPSNTTGRYFQFVSTNISWLLVVSGMFPRGCGETRFASLHIKTPSDGTRSHFQVIWGSPATCLISTDMQISRWFHSILKTNISKTLPFYGSRTPPFLPQLYVNFLPCFSPKRAPKASIACAAYYMFFIEQLQTFIITAMQ